MARAEHGYGGNGPAADDAISLGEILALLERRIRLIALTAAVFVAATFVYVGTRTPTYRASATLMLLEEVSSTGLLADLASLTSSPAAESEMAILRSRSLVEDTVRPPASPRLGEGPDGALQRSTDVFLATRADSVAREIRTLGLTTLVQPEDLSPFATMWRRLTGGEPSEHRLVAGVEGPEKPDRLRVTFPDADHVRLEVETGLLSGGAEVLVPYVAGQAIEAFGLEITLVGLGDYAGKSYGLRRIPLNKAVKRVLDRLKVRESARNSGVIQVTVSDSDPNRAAELANALCQNYILRSIEIGGYRASETVEFIDDQLTDEQVELERYEKELVELKAANPQVIDITAFAGSLIDRLTAFELERARMGLARKALGEASTLLSEGQFDAVARLGRDLPDLESLTIIQEIGKLTSESLLFTLHDAGPFRLLLEQEISTLRQAIDAQAIHQEGLERIVALLEEGDAGAITRLASLTQRDEGLAVVWREYVAEFARIDAEIGSLEGIATADHPDLMRLRSAKVALVGEVLDLARSAAAGMRAVRADREALLETYRRAIDALPGQERGKVDAAIATLRGRMLGNLRSRMAGLEADAQAVAARIAELERQLADLPGVQLQLADPMRRVAAHTQIVQFLLESQQQAELSKASILPSAVHIDPAVPSESRSSPRVVLSLVVAAILGTFAGIGLAFLRQSLLGSIYTVAELEDVTGLPVFGTVPDFRHGRLRVKGAGERYLPLLADPGGLIAESYRSIRANLRFALEPEKPMRTLAVTSCAPREGKTITNIDLAMAFATGGRRVLLVDADMRKPNIHNHFDLPLSPGFAEAIVEGADWRGLVRPSPLESLSILTAGKYAGPRGEYLSNERSGQLVDEFLEDFEMVVFDLPPAIIVADVEAFAHKLDALILLYRAGGLPREALASAAKRIRASGANLVGSILNAVRPTRSGSRSYYGYGYGYGYGSQQEQPQASAGNGDSGA